MSFEYLDQTLIFALVVFQAFQLETAGAEATRRGVFQCRDIFRRFLAGINQVFGQGADDAITASVNIGNLVRMFTSSFDYTTGR